MKILVTGCAGFIGFNLTLKLLKIFPKSKIFGIDNFDKYYSVSLKKKRKSILIKNKKFFFKNIDLNDNKNLKNFLFKTRPYIIFNLAAQAGVRYSLINPRKYVNTNINGFFNLCEIAKKINVKKIFYASSSSVYGESNSFPLKETTFIKPKNIYGLSKKINEEMAEVFSLNSKIKFIGLRFFTVFGPWGRPDMMITKYIFNSLNNKKFELFNHGNHTRDFTYIDDVTNILVKLVNKKISKHEIFNICSSKPIHLKKVITKLNKFLKKTKIIKKPLQKADIKKTHGSNKKIINFVKYKNFYNFDHGLKNTFNWCSNYLNKKKL